MLALEPNRVVPLERLVDGLWGEHPPASATKMVQLYVSQLRRLLDGADAEIVTRGRGYELRMAPEGIDVARFERLIAGAEGRGGARPVAGNAAGRRRGGSSSGATAQRPRCCGTSPPCSAASTTAPRPASCPTTRATRRRRPPGPVQAGIEGWLADNGAASAFVWPVACGQNPSNFCDAGLEAAVARAQSARGPEADARWRTVYARADDAAPIVPLLNRRTLTLVSERVGGYQDHPLWGPLLDQLWVR